MIPPPVIALLGLRPRPVKGGALAPVFQQSTLAGIMPGSIRLIVAGPLGPGAEPLLDRAQAHYLGRVMRLRLGAELVLCNGRDGAWRARLVALGQGGGRAKLEQQLCGQHPEPGPWLAFAYLKRGASEMLVQKATELGVERLLPYRAERSVGGAPNLVRLAAIAREAAEQSERLTCPEIAAGTTSLAALLAVWPNQRPLFAAIERRPSPPPSGGIAAGLLVGPEGGFTEGELDLLARTPFVRPASLGPRILRAETAAIAGVVLLAASVGGFI
ncbi:MAG: RsmE family RNA methyltransferase [Acetobacteraceae bacterium]